MQDLTNKKCKYSVSEEYINAIEKAQGACVIIPWIFDNDKLERIVKSLDGILLTDGCDVNPRLYKESKHELCKDICEKRDEYEMKIISLAVKHNVSILGIGRGCNLLNVYFKGTLYQDNSLCDSNTINHNPRFVKKKLTHSINVRKDSFLYDIFGDYGLVNSFHHQSIHRIGRNMRRIALSSDNVVEAIEHKYLPYIGIQFSPEKMCNEEIKMQMIFDKWIKQI